VILRRTKEQQVEESGRETGKEVWLSRKVLQYQHDTGVQVLENETRAYHQSNHSHSTYLVETMHFGLVLSIERKVKGSQVINGVGTQRAKRCVTRLQTIVYCCH
jgi:hypothetical protein